MSDEQLRGTWADAIAAVDEDEEFDDSTLVPSAEPAQDPSQVYSIRIPVRYLEELRRTAEALGERPSSLMRRWVVERLEHERMQVDDVDLTDEVLISERSVGELVRFMRAVRSAVVRETERGRGVLSVDALELWREQPSTAGRPYLMASPRMVHGSHDFVQSKIHPVRKDVEEGEDQPLRELNETWAVSL